MSEFVLEMTKPLPKGKEIEAFKHMMKESFEIDRDMIVYSQDIILIHRICVILSTTGLFYEEALPLWHHLVDSQYPYTRSYEIGFMDFIILWLWRFITRNAKLAIGVCPTCKKAFLKTSINKEYCSDLCSSVMRGRKYRLKITKKGVSK